MGNRIGKARPSQNGKPPHVIELINMKRILFLFQFVSLFPFLAAAEFKIYAHAPSAFCHSMRQAQGHAQYVFCGA